MPMLSFSYHFLSVFSSIATEKPLFLDYFISQAAGWCLKKPSL